MQLDVRPSAIYHWISGRTAPHRIHTEIIQRLARERGLRLTIDEISGVPPCFELLLGHFKDRRNLPLIRQHGGLYPVTSLKKKED
jgi:hypothetical protein